MRMIRIVDTTLRDGEQTPGVQLSPARKLELALQFEKLGIDVIEAGFPASSEGDAKAVRMIAESVGNDTVISALARSQKNDIDVAAQAIAPAARRRIHVFIATSDIHIVQKFKTTREEILRQVREAVSYAVPRCDEVEFSAEDATRSDPDYLIEVFRTAADAGAAILNVPDTVGYAMTEEFSALVHRVYSEITSPRSLSLSVHCHDDLGLAVANSLAAIRAGADSVECTVNGLGERAGNASLEEIALALATRKDALDAATRLKLDEIVRTSRLVSAATGVAVSPGKAIVGANAFLHSAGIHQHGMLCDRNTYEIIDPASIGLTEQTIVLGKLSGKHAVQTRIEQLGYHLDEAGVQAVFMHFKDVAEHRNTVTDDDIRAIVNDYLDIREGKYRLASFQIQSGNHIRAMAMITLAERANPDEEISRAAIGDGPIDAAFNAVKEALGIFRFRLESYNINAITEGADALGEAMVRIRDESGATFTGRSVSSDIIKASIKAYVNAMNKVIAADAESAEVSHEDRNL